MTTHQSLVERYTAAQEAHIVELTQENMQLDHDVQRLSELLNLRLEEHHLDKRQFLILNYLQRWEEKGWTLAFLSPSVVDLLEKSALDEFLEENIRFFYDADTPEIS